jgi:hypothetical protein
LLVFSAFDYFIGTFAILVIFLCVLLMGMGPSPALACCCLSHGLDGFIERIETTEHLAPLNPGDGFTKAGTAELNYTGILSFAFRKEICPGMT